MTCPKARLPILRLKSRCTSGERDALRSKFSGEMESDILRFVHQLRRLRFIVALALCLPVLVYAQDTSDAENHAGHVPVISGGIGYIHNVDGGVPTLEPQITPVLLVPFGSHVLLESRTEFFGFFQREN